MLEQRRTIRRFKSEPVSEKDIEKVLSAISQAPHCDMKQHIDVTVINSREKIMEALPLMTHFYDKLEGWLQNPILCDVIQLVKGKKVLETLNNHVLPRIKKGIYRNFTFDYDGVTRGAHTLLIFHVQNISEEQIEDAVVFVTYATLATQALGLGSSTISFVPPAINNSPKLKKIFEIPTDHNSLAAIIIGYPKFKYLRGIKRELKSVYE